MIKENKIYAAEFTVIILLWSLVIVSPLLFMENYSEDIREIHIFWAECIIVGFAFLVHHFYLMPKMLFSKKFILYAISLLLLFACLSTFIIYFDGTNVILQLFGDESIIPRTPVRTINKGAIPYDMISSPHSYGALRLNKPPGVRIVSPKATLLIASFIVTALDLGIRVAVTWVITEQKHSKIEKERVVSQLQNLQNQVSPHFFMNTLNNIHALVEIDPQRAKRTIIDLSGLMSYLLYDSSNKSKVSLQREMEFINTYINLMRLRFTDQIKITLSYDNPPPIFIPPYLFLNFIENAFKHGVDYEKESFIKIFFKFTDTSVEMITVNTNHSTTTDNKKHGLGIINSRKRLDLLYNDNYTLSISEKDDIFYVNLTIPII